MASLTLNIHFSCVHIVTKEYQHKLSTIKRFQEKGGEQSVIRRQIC